MSNSDLKKVDEIETRWENVSTELYCSGCMHSALRHWRRNEECYDLENTNVHWDEDDLADAFVHSGADIAFLIETIDDLIKKNRKLKKRYKKLKIKENNRKLRKKNKKLEKKLRKILGGTSKE